jgi:hypothetical protein
MKRNCIRGPGYQNEESLLDKLADRFKTIPLSWQRLLESHGILSFAALEPIRGNRRMIAADLMILNKTFSDFETEISVNKIGHRLANICVTVTKANPEKSPVRVSLMSDEREVASYPMRTGNAHFESIPFGHYALTFTRNGVLIGRYPFQIKETGNGSQ